MYGCSLQDLFNSKTTDGLSGRFIGEVVKGTLLQKHQDKWTVSTTNIHNSEHYILGSTLFENKHFSTKKISDCTFKMWCVSFAY